MYCWKVAIAVYVNATILGYRLKKDVICSKNMGRFRPVLVSPGRFGLILGAGTLKQSWDRLNIKLGNTYLYYIWDECWN